MREKNRKPIASIKKLPQFTTMNVIDGQAGLVNYSSLIFYSLTIDNILNIIVLLILAAVSIATLTGDNGLLNKAQEAKIENDKAKEDDLRKLTAIEAATHLTNEDYEDINGDTAVIPAGFAVSQVEGESIIDDGLVVIDKNGNEFVWIPVEITEEEKAEGETFESKYPRTEFSNNAPSSGLDISVYTEPYADGYEEDTEYQAMIESVTEHGGFYVGRYEAGCTTQRTEENKTTKQDVVVKKGAYVYNYVPWGSSMSNTGAYQGVTGAVELSKNFATANGYDTNEVTSTLIYGIQWDMMLRYVADEEHNVNDSSSWGNYSNSTGAAAENSGSSNMNYTTGRNEAWQAKNIYDIAGNMTEWTMEAYRTFYRVYRGGDCIYDGSDSPASDRYTNNPYNSYNVVSFRPVLILQN